MNQSDARMLSRYAGPNPAQHPAPGAGCSEVRADRSGQGQGRVRSGVGLVPGEAGQDGGREGRSAAPPRGTLSRGARHSVPGAMAGRQRHRLLLENAEQLVLVCGRREPYLRRDGAASLGVLRAASLVVGL